VNAAQHPAALSRHSQLVWQQRIGTTRFRSPLVQPHRTLIREGSMTLSRVVKRSIATHADLPFSSTTSGPTLLQVPSLQVKVENKPLIALLCSDILVFVHDAAEPATAGLYTVFRPQPGRSQPAASPFGGDSMLRCAPP
jgi:hypothetical protein